MHCFHCCTVLGNNGLLCFEMGYNRLFWAVLGCTGLFWTGLDCIGLYWAVLGYTGLYWAAEIDISVSKLLGFETFANFLRDSVSEALVLEKSIRFGLKKKSRFRKIWSRKKVSVLVLENVVSEKSLGFGKIWYRKRKNQNTIPSEQCTSLI